MKKRLEKLEEQQPNIENEELKAIYDNYVDAEKKGNEAAAVHYAVLAKELYKDYRYPQPEFTERSLWLKMQKETWRSEAELQRLRKEYTGQEFTGQ